MDDEKFSIDMDINKTFEDARHTPAKDDDADAEEKFPSDIDIGSVFEEKTFHSDLDINGMFGELKDVSGKDDGGLVDGGDGDEKAQERIVIKEVPSKKKPLFAIMQFLMLFSVFLVCGILAYKFMPEFGEKPVSTITVGKESGKLNQSLKKDEKNLNMPILPDVVKTEPAVTPAAVKPELPIKPDAIELNSDGIWIEPLSEMHFVPVSGGCFSMGCEENSYDNEKPVHEVCLDDFWVSKYEVTLGQWKKVVGNSGNAGSGKSGVNFWGCTGTATVSNFKQYDNHPVVCVTWNEAVDFAMSLSQKTGRKFMLPTEAQWEFAARSRGEGKRQLFSGGDKIDDLAWYSQNSNEKTHQVGTKAGNDLGIFDMSGNVWEWCLDWYDRNYYRNSRKDSPAGPLNGQYRVRRGGSWNYDPVFCRSTSRLNFMPDSRGADGGFRLVIINN